MCLLHRRTSWGPRAFPGLVPPVALRFRTMRLDRFIYLIISICLHASLFPSFDTDYKHQLHLRKRFSIHNENPTTFTPFTLHTSSSTSSPSSSMTTTFKGILVTTVTYTSTVVPVFPAGPSFFHRTGAVVETGLHRRGVEGHAESRKRRSIPDGGDVSVGSLSAEAAAAAATRETIPSSRRPFGLDEWVEMPVSPSSSLRRGLSATSSEFIMNPMGVSNGLNTNHLTSRFDDGSMIEEDPAAEWETLNSQRVVTAPFGGASGMPMDYQLAAGTGYLDPVPEGRLMEAQSDPGHATISRSLSSTNQLAHYSTGSLSRTQSLSHGRTLSATPLVDVGASNDGSGSGSGSAPPSRTVSGSRSSRRGSISPYPIDFNEDNEEDYHRRGQDSFSPTPPPLSPVSPYAPLVEIQPPSPSSPTAPSDLSTPTTTKPVERRNRSSSTDQRLDAGVLRATRKQQRREKSHRREMSPSTTAETTKSRSSSVDQGSSHEDGAEVAGVGDRKDEVDRGRNRDDSDDGSSIDISTADQSALSLVDAQDYTRRVLSSL
ncbi:uncharacterized protein EI90DRAFT_3011384 [Cantharellus anzutake]|uniref:uncharacterized protein n=1 Tax=Cantharellus anzutake TaxID=1750568 RepID=UPI001907F66F|nr:uncharacterized protein EI90DRAFT_3011384 [Cantharellus anzutake]KAF8342963.1 hypothetical protein EI90DRAFT_3011384 [Cantharellus anzutake]